jgi:integrase
MSVPGAGDRRPARGAVDDFIRHLAGRQLSITTRRIRRHFLDEYLQHAEEAAGTVDIAAGELMDPARAAAWLSAAAEGKTRTRNTLRGPDAAAYTNSMRVRIDSYNAFAEFLCLPGRLDSQSPASGFYLTPADTERLLHDLTVRRPVHANAATSLRTAAVAALVADTGRGVPELARLKVSALHLDGEARVELADVSCPLGDATAQILTRWLAARAEIIAELEGSDPGHLWIPTKPGRPRGGRPPVKPGLTRAAVRTLHHAHRALVSQVLGTPLRPGAFRASGLSRSRPGQGS